MKRFLPVSLAVVVTLALTPAPARADTPVATPTQLEAVHVADTSADLWWTRSGAAAYDVAERLVGAQWVEYRRNVVGSMALTGLTPGTTYTFRVYSVPQAGLDLVNSAPSDPVTFTTLAGPDTEPPGAPPAPTFSAVTTTGFTVSWGAATDNVQVTQYQLQRQNGTGWTTVATLPAGQRTYTVTGQQPGTNSTFAVIAVDARNNQSARSPAATVQTVGSFFCQVSISQVSGQPPAAVASVIVYNYTPAPVTAWSVKFTIPLSITIASSIGGVATRVGTAGTITPTGSTATIAAGSTQFVNVVGTTSPPYAMYSNFSVNGVACQRI